MTMIGLHLLQLVGQVVGLPFQNPTNPTWQWKTQIWWVPSIPVTFPFEIYIVRSTHSGVISSLFRLWIQQNLAKIHKIQWDLPWIWLNLIGSYEISLDLVIFFAWSSEIFIVCWPPSTIIGLSKSDRHLMRIWFVQPVFLTSWQGVWFFSTWHDWLILGWA